MDTNQSVLPKKNNALGVHYIVECTGCHSNLLTDITALKHAMEECAKNAGATVVETVLHQFNPHGLSGVVVIAESHLAIHTWPEHQYAAIDIFTCGMPAVAEGIYQNIIRTFAPTSHSMQRIERAPAPPLL